MCQIKEVGIDKFDREIYEQWRASGKLIPDGVNTKYIAHHRPLAAWKKQQTA